MRRPEEADHARVIAAIGSWWPDGRGAAITLLLPRLFFQHFTSTSVVMENEDGGLRAFLIGFQSADHPEVAYIHFVGVAPEERGRGTARSLYERFFADMSARGCTVVRAITGVDNRVSQAFHRSMGFTVSDPIGDYDGPGETRVTMSRSIDGT